MTKILIVGASPAGLLLAHGLLDHSYDVTLINAASSHDIRYSHRPAITHFTLPTALAHEQVSGLAMWEHLAPRISGARVHLHPPGASAMTVESAFATYGVSVDRRVKSADWLEFAEDRGAKVVISGITISDLEFFWRMYDLVILATGHGELSALFAPASNAPVPARRAVAQAILTGVAETEAADRHVVGPPPGAPPGYLPEPVVSDHAEVASSPEIRAILSPVLVDSGPQHVLQLMGSSGGPMDAWPERPGRDDIWRRMAELTRQHAPALFERIEDAGPVPEQQDVSLHSYAPHVRNPVGHLPSGGLVLGMAEAVIATDDPVAAQAQNMAIASASHYLSRILAHTGAFSPAWMTETFEGLWQGTPCPEFPFAGMGRAITGLSEVLDLIWAPEAPPHLAEVLGAATHDQRVADRFVGGLDDPRSYAWLQDPHTAKDYLSSLTRP
ncbi:hypothetical protein IDM40_00585 [Nocardiopsis sp. HNM0947]|uniref:Styrene monooxygenase StyA putative substrate binding domain-containing protein n=1 Tax=Nocardiopsis coralli TaxID=2772213 RepID=A0ABR9P042_9ACTN|nr:styrene monooxygenase/indole monooxygenase family protein [Nocardiopsis coralli]MBE2997202.1 hypothetical protein [Nocardiopsis coralli]